MFKKIRTISQIAFAAALAIFSLTACEPDADQLGIQLVDGDAAEALTTNYPLIAYNLNNNDSIRTDAVRTDSVKIGAFTENIFGMHKAALVSQVRMLSYAPDLNDNPVLDSAVMIIKPAIYSDSITTSTDEDYKWSEENIPAKKVVSTYQLKKYGHTKLNNGSTKMTLNVREVTEFLGSNADLKYSNASIAISTNLGTKLIGTTVNKVEITKDSDNSSLFTTNDATIRIPLLSSFFQTKIIDKAKSQELQDASNFIRYFRGVKIDITDNDGFFFALSPNDAKIRLYYKSSVTANGTTTRTQKTLDINLADPNARLIQSTFNRAGTKSQTALAAINSTTGDAKLYLQGMGGPGAKIKIPAATIAELKSKIHNEKIGIISAKIRLSNDAEWNNNFQKPGAFIFNRTGATTLLSDITNLGNAYNFAFIKAYDLKGAAAHYDITITDSLKKIVEDAATAASDVEYTLNLGTYRSGSTGYFGQTFTDRPYNPRRIVLTGTQPGNANATTLKIIYGKK